MDALAKAILENPLEALGIVSALVSALVAVLSKVTWFKVPEADVRRWAAQVFGSILVGLATEWLAPPFEWQKAALVTFAALGGSLAVFRAVKWLLAKFEAALDRDP